MLLNSLRILSLLQISLQTKGISSFPILQHKNLGNFPDLQHAKEINKLKEKKGIWNKESSLLYVMNQQQKYKTL